MTESRSPSQRVRRINDELVADARREGRAGATLPLICECGRARCFHPVWIRADEFARIRESGGRLLAVGHADGAATGLAA